MTRSLYRIGRACAAHPFRTFGAWLVVAIVVFTASSNFGGELEDDFTVPGVESQRAFDRLEERFPAQTNAVGRLVFEAPVGHLDDSGNGVVVTKAMDAVANGADVTAVAPLQLSPDRQTGFVDITYDEQKLTRVHYDDALAAIQPARDAGLQAELDGSIAWAGEAAPKGKETLGVLAAVVVLLVAFGSVIAMGIPIGTALFGIAIGLAGVTLLAGHVNTPTLSPMLAGMIGLGVGIDYALFIVTRHRSNLANGNAPVEAAAHANATAGAAVLFAGATVVIAILGLQVAGIPAITAMGWASAIVVAVSVAAALTLIPAFLGLTGRHIDRLRLPQRRNGRDESRTNSRRWASHVGTHPWPYALATLALLVALAAPVTAMRIGMGDDGTADKSTTQRRAYDLLSDGFGAGFNGALQIVVDISGDDADEALPALRDAIAATPGVAEVGPIIRNDLDDTALIQAIPTTSPQAESTANLVHRLREEVVPQAIGDSNAEAMIGSNTALLSDLSDRLMTRLPWFIGAVVLLSFLLLIVMFRSLLVPAKAALMNLLSIGAAYGVVVAVFQWGWGGELLGLEDTMAINPFVPLIMFAVLFGLSMDYEVFLLSRVRESFARTGDSHSSVVDGLGSTARVITSAALIMMCVFGVFIFGSDPVMKMFGLGLTVAVLIDATLVRMVLVPATMSLLGRANWWLPGWLDRLLPNVDLDAADTEVTSVTPSEDATALAA